MRMPDIDGPSIGQVKDAARRGGHPCDRPRHGPLGGRGHARGAFNYLLKPLDIAQLRAAAEKAVESSRLRRTNVELNRRLDEKFGFEGVIGDSPQMRDVIERAQTHRPDQRQRADPGRDRHRQGTGRPGDPPEQPAEEQAVRGAELRRA